MIREIREALAAAVTTAAPQITVYDHIPVDPTVPCAFITWPSLIDFEDQTLAGHPRVDIAVTVAAGLGDVRAAQVSIDALITTLSTALSGASSDAWRWCQVVNVSQFRPAEDRLQADINLSIQ